MPVAAVLHHIGVVDAQLHIVLVHQLREIFRLHRYEAYLTVLALGFYGLIEFLLVNYLVL